MESESGLCLFCDDLPASDALDNDRYNYKTIPEPFRTSLDDDRRNNILRECRCLSFMFPMQF